MRLARFVPVRMDNLRPEAMAHVGEVKEWIYAGTQDHDMPYAGQTTWMPSDGTMGWIPEEDLEEVMI